MLPAHSSPSRVPPTYAEPKSSQSLPLLRAAALLAAALISTGCSTTASSSSAADVPTAGCLDAAVEALEQEQVLYDTHPLWKAEMPDSEATEQE